MDSELNIILHEGSPRDPLIKDSKNVSEINTLTPIYNKIYIGDLLTYIKVTDIPALLQQIKSKLTTDGKIVIEEFDQLEVAFAVVNDKISSLDFNNIIRQKEQILSIPDIVDILQKTNYKIISKDIDALKHIIVAT